MPLDLRTVEALGQELLAVQHRGRRVTLGRLKRLHPELKASSGALLLRLERVGVVHLTSLASMLGMDRASVDKRLEPLVRAGLVERRHRENGRGGVVHITDTGRRRVEDVHRAAVRDLGATVAGWPDEDVETLTRLLARLNRMASARPR